VLMKDWDIIEEEAPAFMETLTARDLRLEELWRMFGDIPMDPETETMGEPFLFFPAGAHREEIWHWFDERYSKGVARLMHLIWARYGAVRTVQEGRLENPLAN